MEQKYFTPDIEDIRVGYELEYNLSGEDWNKITVNLSDFYTGVVAEFGKENTKGLRVPYLYKEQIENEGWDMQNVLREDDNGNDMFSTGFVKTIDENHWYELILEDDHKIFMQYKWYRNSVAQIWRTIFYGECRCINEFRWICKLLGI